MPEETFETPQPVQPVESKSTNWTKIILVAVLGFGLLATSAYAGYWFGTQQVQPVEKPTPAVSQPVSTPTPEPAPVLEDETTDWKTLTSPKGYSIKYPKHLFLEERVAGFYILLEDSQNPTSVSFYVDDRGVKTLSEREQIRSDLVRASVSILGLDNVDGFIIEGIMGPGYGEGTYVKTAYIDLNGRELILGCEGTFCKSELFDQILSTFRFLE